MTAQASLIDSMEFTKAETIALYAPVDNEIETYDVMREALASDKRVLLPAVSPAGLEFRRIADPSELRKGVYGIPEPDVGCPLHSLDETDLVLVPGVVFDIAGRRIGYGKGYYDRALQSQEGKGKLVGFCYDFQVVDEIPGESHDVRMDMIFTERRVIRLKN